MKYFKILGPPHPFLKPCTLWVSEFVCVFVYLYVCVVLSTAPHAVFWSHTHPKEFLGSVDKKAMLPKNACRFPSQHVWLGPLQIVISVFNPTLFFRWNVRLISRKNTR